MTGSPSAVRSRQTFKIALKHQLAGRLKKRDSVRSNLEPLPASRRYVTGRQKNSRRIAVVTALAGVVIVRVFADPSTRSFPKPLRPSLFSDNVFELVAAVLATARSAHRDGGTVLRSRSARARRLLEQ